MFNTRTFLNQVEYILEQLKTKFECIFQQRHLLLLRIQYKFITDFLRQFKNF